MDDGTFDRVTRFVAQHTSRRGALGGLAAAAAAAALAGLGLHAEAKKKKKKKKKTCKSPNTKCGKKGCCTPGQACRNGACQGPCVLTGTGNTLTLQRDCVSQFPIDIPAGKTLDGAGHTIFFQGTTAGLPYGVGAQGGESHVTNLTIDGSGVTGSCAQRGVGIQFKDAAGSIRDSEITGLSQACGFGISVIVFGGASPARTVDIDNVAISDVLAGITSSGINKLTLGITECDIQDVSFGIQVQYNVEAAITSNEIAATTYGVVVLSSAAVNAAPNVTATNNTVTGAQIGMSVAADQANPGAGTPTLVAGGNIIEGPGSVSGTTHGLQFGKQSAGSTAGNTISNFSDSRGSAGCGIFVAADAGAVFIGPTDEFPDPPNEQDICDNRP